MKCANATVLLESLQRVGVDFTHTFYRRHQLLLTLLCVLSADVPLGN